MSYVPPPPELVAMRRHVAACPLCGNDRDCRTGIALTRRWLVYESRRKAGHRPPV